MEQEKIQIIRNTWSYVIINPQEAGELFYQKLFELAPHLRPMFKGDIKEQSKKLMRTITVAVTKLDKLDDLLPEIQALAKRHVGYGVKPSHYAPVGAALIWTLEKGLGPKWTPEVATAWTELYLLLSQAMIEAVENKATKVA